ncbi:hypothetical protein RRG08_017165 [Elysia crispata]|uniref:Uncharacterized protein n=1 Tax=Elysia crispata TaxID=231223 RepID=A0AAE1B322_9GAST|nr:hypothetical protein RRG08_017165 [Elysia crispata]
MRSLTQSRWNPASYCNCSGRVTCQTTGLLCCRYYSIQPQTFHLYTLKPVISSHPESHRCIDSISQLSCHTYTEQQLDKQAPVS